MQRRHTAITLIIMLLALGNYALRAATVNMFTSAEQQWIKDHPVVSFATEPWLPPIDSVENGKHASVVDAYLSAITRKSGLRFRYVTTNNWLGAQRAFIDKQVDLLPDVAIGRLQAETAHQMAFTDPYYATPTVIVTQGHQLVTLDPGTLDGKKIVTSGAYASTLIHRFPSATLIEVKDTVQALELVYDGHADVAIGPEAVIGPILRRKYAGRMGISGSLDDLPFVAHMGVRRDDQLLYSILQKSLSSLSAVETDDMLENVLTRTDYGKPTLVSIIRYRAVEIVALALFIGLLILFAYRTRVARRFAEQSELAKSRFLAVMSHEIRTPMNAVIASIELLRRTEMDDRQITLTRTAFESAESLLELLDDVLDLSKLDAKRLTLEYIPTDIGSLTRKTINIIYERALAKKLAVRINIDCPDNRDALIDPTRFKQVLVNLLTNALKFTEQGQIRVDLSIVDDPTAQDRARLSVDVTDTGIGISPDNQAVLFQAYTQADSSTTRRYGGSGLGLTISRDLVELMGGSITLESAVGIGTKVGFTLPVMMVDRVLASIAPPQQLSQERVGNSATAVPLLVLLVEDHIINQQVTREQLLELGVDSLIAGDGMAALDAIQKKEFDLVLMDCHMPEMDGYEVTRRIRQIEASAGSRHLPIVALSAATDATHLQRCLSSGMDGVLRKPVRLKELRNILEIWIGALPLLLERSQTERVVHIAKDFRYSDSLLEDVDALTRALDADTASELVHRLKGAAYVAQLNSIGKLAEQLENLIKVRQTSFQADATPLLKKIHDEIKAIDS